MTIRNLLALSLVACLSACGSESPSPSADAGAPSPASSPTAAAAPAAPAAPASSGDAGKQLEGIVLRYAPGGRPDAFCEPQWSIANQTGTDISAMLIQIAWLGPDGTELQAVGQFGSLFENLGAGRLLDRSLIGHPVACDALRIVVGTYACRDENAVRTTCPGPLHVITEGGIQADVSGLAEGPLRGAMEP